MQKPHVTSDANPSTTVIPQNRFGLSEWSGAVGDLGTLLPLAFALVTMNGFPAVRLFLLWGLAYIAAGWFFRVPVAIQPLKAMSVIAITAGIPAQMLSTTSVLFGVILLLLAEGGLIARLQRLFSRPIVRGIQLGVGLMLARKAMQIVLNNGLFLHHDTGRLWVSGGTLAVCVGLIVFLIYKKLPAGVFMIITGMAIGWWVIGNGTLSVDPGAVMMARFPDVSFWWTAIPLLIVPQLPLTLGNAVFAADDVAHTLWRTQASRVTPRRLALSIGLCDVGLGLLGGFPICHGSGGMAAHERFGAQTGGATIIMGAILVCLALVPGMSGILFLVPVPILGAMLLIDGMRMAWLTTGLASRWDMCTALVVGLVSFVSRNLTLGVVTGLVVVGVARAAAGLGLLGATENSN